jgi:hypothetical protein
MAFGSWIEIAAIVLVGALFIAVPVAITLVLIRIGFRRMSGRRGAFDGLFTGIARANGMWWHLNGGGPHPDDVNAVPPPPGPRVRRKRRR